MELYPTLDMIGDYFTKALEGQQYRHFHNIILGIHEDEIPTYNEPRRALLKEQKVKLEREKEEPHQATIITGD